MNILKKITLEKNYTPREQELADFLITETERFLQLNAKEITSLCHVSSATLYRFIEKSGCSGFGDFKVAILKDYDSFKHESNSFDFDFPIYDGQSETEIIGSLYHDYLESLLSTRNLLSIEEIRKFIPKMKQAKEIDIFSSAGNIYFAQNFKFQMQEIGIHVQVPIEEYEQRLFAAKSSEETFAILITFGGRGMLAPILPKILKGNDTPILLISSPEVDKKAFSADYQLFINQKENHYNKISSFSTRLSILFILDVLYGCFFVTDYDTYLKQKLRYYKGIATNG